MVYLWTPRSICPKILFEENGPKNNSRGPVLRSLPMLASKGCMARKWEQRCSASVSAVACWRNKYTPDFVQSFIVYEPESCSRSASYTEYYLTRINLGTLQWYIKDHTHHLANTSVYATNIGFTLDIWGVFSELGHNHDG